MKLTKTQILFLIKRELDNINYTKKSINNGLQQIRLLAKEETQ